MKNLIAVDTNDQWTEITLGKKGTVLYSQGNGVIGWMPWHADKLPINSTSNTGPKSVQEAIDRLLASTLCPAELVDMKNGTYLFKTQHSAVNLDLTAPGILYEKRNVAAALDELFTRVDTEIKIAKGSDPAISASGETISLDLTTIRNELDEIRQNLQAMANSVEVRLTDLEDLSHEPVTVSGNPALNIHDQQVTLNLAAPGSYNNAAANRLPVNVQAALTALATPTPVVHVARQDAIALEAGFTVDAGPYDLILLDTSSGTTNPMFKNGGITIREDGYYVVSATGMADVEATAHIVINEAIAALASHDRYINATWRGRMLRGDIVRSNWSSEESGYVNSAQLFVQKISQ